MTETCIGKKVSDKVRRTSQKPVEQLYLKWSHLLSCSTYTFTITGTLIVKPQNILLLALFFFLLGCTSKTFDVTAISSVQPTRTTRTQKNEPRAEVATETPIAPTSSIVPSATAYSSPIPTASPTILPNATMSSVVEEKMQRLYDFSSFCQFPCIWGVVPGETTMTEFRALFMAEFFPVIDYATWSSKGRDGYDVYEFLFSRLYEDAYGYYISPIFYVNQSTDVIDQVNLFPVKIPYTDLSNILDVYGVPDDYFVYRQYNPHGSSVSFVLDYLSDSFAVEYFLEIKEIESTNYICVTDIAGISIDLLNTNIKYSAEDYFSYAEEANGIKKISEVTNFTKEEISLMLFEMKGDVCLEIDINALGYRK